MRYIFIPGLGADSRIFAEYVKCFQNTLVPDWLPPSPRESLRDYARRLALSIPPSSPCVVVGLSFGGMLAPYIAEEIHAEHCILLSSAKSVREFPTYYRLGYLLFRYLPRLAYMMILLAKCGVRSCGWLLGTKFKSVREQFLESPTRRIFLFLKMMFNWAYETSETETEAARLLHIIQIHGQNDRLIPIKNLHPDVILPSARHLFILTHFDALRPILSKLEQEKGNDDLTEGIINCEDG